MKLDPDISEKVLDLVEANQPVPAARVAALLKQQHGIELDVNTTTFYLLKLRTNFPRRVSKSADRFSVVRLG